MGEELYAGKVKSVWSTEDPDILEFRFSDRISVFDQIIPSLIPQKGATLNRTAAHWFELVAAEGICATHLLEVNGPERCRVRRVDIHREAGTTPRDGEWVFVPLEFICRHYLAGSAWRAVQKGTRDPATLGITGEATYGMKLPEPVLEITTKFEAYDRVIDREEALAISNLRESELDAILEAVVRIDELIEREAAKGGLIHVDGKKEFALGTGRELVLVDTFGTLDEDRWWDAAEHARGEVRELSKEFVRDHYVAAGHQAALQAARDAGTEDPAIPALPQEMIDRTSALYLSMCERLTGSPL